VPSFKLIAKWATGVVRLQLPRKELCLAPLAPAPVAHNPATIARGAYPIPPARRRGPVRSAAVPTDAGER
jgi:hypothetical protein